MRLQTLKSEVGMDPKVLTETPWHDEASNGGAYRDRLKQYLGGFFEHDDEGMQPKSNPLSNTGKPAPDAVRLVDDSGKVIEIYDVNDLMRDTRMAIIPAAQRR
jgi:hypothetical protein